MSKEKQYVVRKFLNPKEGMATLQIKGDKDTGFGITISDCYKAVTLDLEWYRNDKERIARKKKLDLLISELTKAREYFFGTDE